MNLRSLTIYIVAIFLLILASPHTSRASTINVPGNYLAQNSGLVGWWTFDGKDTNWNTNKTNDISGQGNTATLNGMATSSSPVPGKLGQALRFDGASSYVATPFNVASNLSNDFTISFWSYTPDVQITKYYSAADSGASRFYFGPNSSSGHDLILGLGSWNPVLTGYLVTGSWQFYTVVLSGTTGYLYANDVQISTQAGITVSNPSATLNIGRNVAASGYFSGTIDDFRIYNRALSTTEITNLYNVGISKRNITTNTRGSLQSGLVGYWSFDGKDTPWTSATAATTKDLSGNGNTGTLTNMNRATSPVPGKIGQALNFDDISTEVNAGSASSLDDIQLQGGGGMTISAWIYPRSFGESSVGVIATKGTTNGGVAPGIWFLRLESSNSAIRFTKDYDGTDLTIKSASNSFTSRYFNTWIHLVLTWDGSATAGNGRMYLNGTALAMDAGTDGTGNAVSDAAENVYMGSDKFTSGTFDGYIDDVHIYNRVLSATEIAQLYNSNQSKYNVAPNSPGTLSNGLVGYWTLDGKDTPWTSASAATTKDLSGNGNTGTLTNMSRATSPVPGVSGQALRFDGTDDAVDAGSGSSLDDLQSQGNGGMSVSFWINPNPSPTPTAIYFMAKGPHSNNQGAWDLAMNSTTYPYRLAFFKEGSTDFSVNLNFVVVPGIWQHLVVTWDGGISSASSVQVYRNTVQMAGAFGSAGSAPNSDASNDFTFGNSTSNIYLDGSLDNIRLYNRILTAAEIAQLYKGKL